MSEHNPRLKEVLGRVNHLAPVTFFVEVNGPLAVALCGYAMACNVSPETIIAEAVRVYLGDA
jgi:hypothetical protein